jgi:drug/metabolite transporter (DMT)-like permease
MDRLIGVFLVALYAVLVATNPIFASISYDAGANPVTFLFIRFLIASPVMFLIMKARGFSIPHGKLLVSLFLIGAIATGAILCFFVAIRLAPVNLVIIIFYMFPTIVTLLSAAFLKQPITGYKFVALLITIAGILLAIGMHSGGYVLGIVLAIMTALFHSLYFILGSVSIKKVGSLSASTIIILPSLVIFGVIVGFQGPQWPMNISGWMAIIASALISTIFARIAFYEGLRRIDTANAAIISTFEVVVTVTLAFIVLGETITLQKILGACLVISAVVILAKSEYKMAHAKISHAISR